MNVIPAFLEDQSLILFGIHYDHDDGEKDRAFCTEGGGFDRLSLAPRDVRRGVPQGAYFVREWGAPQDAYCGVPLRKQIVRRFKAFLLFCFS
jgi:hypothetical protein